MGRATGARHRRDNARHVINNPLKYTDPSGHDPCTGIPGTYQPDCNVNNDPPITPPQPPPFGSNLQLLTPNGNGGVSYYTYPVVNNPDITNPAQLGLENSPHDQDYYTRQGSVRLNNQNWNYICNDVECTAGQWRQNASSCAYASSTQCLTPLEKRSPNTLTSGAVAVAEDGGRIPLGSSQVVLIYAPNADSRSPFSYGLYVNTRDACPACASLQVDVLSLNGFVPLNTKDGLVIPVYIWLVVPGPSPTEIRPISGPY